MAGKLGADGRLTAEEKQRRKDNGLCTYCGEAHPLKQCLKLETQLRGTAISVEDPDLVDLAQEDNTKNEEAA